MQLLHIPALSTHLPTKATPNPSSARPAEQVDSPGFGDAPGVMSVSANSIAITPREHLSATGAQGC